MALKGRAELHQEFEELRGTNWFQGLLVANRFFSPPMLLVLPNLLLLLLALLLLRIRFHMGQITRQNHAPLRLGSPYLLFLSCPELGAPPRRNSGSSPKSGLAFRAGQAYLWRPVKAGLGNAGCGCPKL